jgi:hypothetical protein
MPKIIIRADTPKSEIELDTLSERIVSDNLESRHYTDQLLERIAWAAADAEAAESGAVTREP